ARAANDRIRARNDRRHVTGLRAVPSFRHGYDRLCSGRETEESRSDVHEIRHVVIRFFCVLVALSVLTGCTRGAGDEQNLVDRATLTLREMARGQNAPDIKALLPRAKGIVICPSVLKAGFLAAGEGGNCVLLGRAPDGQWSYPAFVDIGGGSFGI